jgi:hypothetical protein
MCVLIATGVAACSILSPGTSSPDGFVGRRGHELTLHGQPLREISFNKHDLLHQFVPIGDEHQGVDARPAAIDALRTLGEHGFTTIRVNASPFYPAWFEQAFFDDSPEREAQKRASFFAGFDAMLDEADGNGVRIVATLVWNIENLADLGHHSLAEGIRDPRSAGRRRVEEYIREVVSRYRDRPTIAMWEISNEFNLFADLQHPGGVLAGSDRGDHLHPGPLVRDAQNNFTSGDLAGFYRDIAELIRSIDPHHLITTGTSAPRPAAMHLLRAARADKPVDWTQDSARELAEYISMLHPDPIDVISVHYYDDGMVGAGGVLGSPANLQLFRQIAGGLGKPLFIGEIGLHGEIPGLDYRSDEALTLLATTLPTIVELEIPLTLYWTFNDDRSWNRQSVELKLRYGTTDAPLDMIERANRVLSQQE